MEPVTGIEINPRWRLSGPLHLAYRANKIDIEVSGQTRLGSWNKAEFFPLPPGRHEVRVSCKAFTGATSMHAMTTVFVEEGKVSRLDYTVPATFLGTLANGFNRGKLAQTDTAIGITAVQHDTSLAASAGGTSAPALTCTTCNHLLPSGGKFCPACGTPVSQPSETLTAKATRACAGCGSTLPMDTKFCHECGASVF